MDWGPLGSSAHGILQARILEWVAMPCSGGSSRPRDRIAVSYFSCIGRSVITAVINAGLWDNFSETLLGLRTWPGEAGLGQPGDSSGPTQSWFIREHAADATGDVSLFFFSFFNIITGLLLKLPVTKLKFFFFLFKSQVCSQMVILFLLASAFLSEYRCEITQY